MILIARSVFWLTVAYMVIRPGTDLPDAQALSAQAMAAGSQVVAAQIDAIACDTLQCAGVQALAAAAIPSSPQAGLPMHEQPAANLAPLPRPRPDRAG